MKKVIALILVICILSIFSTSCTRTPPTPMETVKNLIGEGNYAEAYAILESIDSEEAEQMKSRFRYLPSLLKSDGRVYYEITYNESGLPSKIVYTSTDGDLTIDEYSYDESGKVVTYQNKPQGIDGTSVYNYTYDDAGNKIGEECTLYTGKKTNYSYTYDAGSNMTRLIFTTDTGHSETTDYVYDAGGNLIRMDIFSDGISVGVVEYTYDSNGNLLEQVSTSSSGSKTTESYTYDEKGNLTEKRANGYTYQYSYDENGNCISEVFIRRVSARQEEYTYTYHTYDENGRLTKTVYKYPTVPVDGTTVYSYDDYGNTVRVESKRGDSAQIRTVEYVFLYLPLDLPEVIEDKLSSILP